jgi:DNA-binding GntR family transcriptional regulator
MPELDSLPPLASSGSLVDRIHEALGAAIISGGLDPGTRLREIPLAKHFGVSTTPLREALRRLDFEGLIDLHPRRGAVVVDLDPATVAQLYEIRAILETGAVRRAAEAGHREADLAPLLALMTEASHVLHEPAQVAFNQIDVRLHRALNELSGNPELAALAERTHRRIQAVRVRCAVHLPGRPALSHAQHQVVIGAVRDGDPDRAEAAVRAHVESVRDSVLGVLSALPRR